ncbi:MAG TPA: hypothetical protein VG368_00105 [Acidimicrobiales bacterium]|nr:hypothetical protein [Acidimicrobiales bacterium]
MTIALGTPDAGVVERYLALGLSIGRHIDGFVDAYYGPPELRARIDAAPAVAPVELVARARSLIGAIDAGEPLDSNSDGAIGSEVSARRRFLRVQSVGLLMSATVLSGVSVGYADEVEACYGVRPVRPERDTIYQAHRELEAVVPGTGPLAERLVSWRESLAVDPEVLPRAIGSLAEDLRDRTARTFGLPDDEHVDFVLEKDKPWSGFNYYLGGLTSKVAINIDLPVLSSALAHLVAHEAYPGHHTEHSRKEVGLVRGRHFLEESIFLVGTPQCLIAEGLADLGLEIVMGRRPEALIAEHLRPLGIRYEPEQIAVNAEAGEALGSVRSLAAFRLHEDGADPDTVAEEVAALGLTSLERAKKSVAFLLDPTWRSYISCYVEGLPLCRRFVGGRPERFERLITEQLVPDDLAA